jgi:hypothetical protein
MKIVIVLLLSINAWLLSFLAYGQNNESKKFVISHIIYDGLDDYVQLFTDIYEDLGFQVSIIPTPSFRGLVLLNDGVVDADLVRVKKIAEKYPNVMLVNLPINTGTLILLCIKGVPCHKDILLDKDSNILLGKGTEEQFESNEILATKIWAQVYYLPEMLKAKRQSYGIYTIDNALGKELHKEFNYVILKELHLYHIINKKHAALLPQIEAKLREKLPAFIAKRNK